jgi:hypothetical protein
LAGDSSPKESATEVFGLVKDYAKQETLDPIKGLLDFAKWGLIGSLLVGIGLIELTVAVLRVTQVETDTWFDGRWSVAPYGITLLVAGIVLYATKRAMSSKKSPTAKGST